MAGRTRPVDATYGVESSRTDRRGRRGLRACLLLLALSLSPSLTGCHSMTYRIGMGGNGIGQQTMHQYYLFFGLFQLNEVDIQRVVGDYTSWDVEVGFSYRDGFLATMGDFFVSVLLFPLTVTRQTVTVKY